MYLLCRSHWTIQGTACVSCWVLIPENQHFPECLGVLREEKWEAADKGLRRSPNLFFSVGQRGRIKGKEGLAASRNHFLTSTSLPRGLLFSEPETPGLAFPWNIPPKAYADKRPSLSRMMATSWFSAAFCRASGGKRGHSSTQGPGEQKYRDLKTSSSATLISGANFSKISAWSP